MILNDVTHRAGRIVVGAPASFHADRFGDGDPDVIDVGAIENRFEYHVAESKRQNVLNAFFPEVMVDSEDLIFMQHFSDGRIQFACALEVVPERLFEYDPYP